VLLVEDGNHGEYRPRSEEFVSAGAAFIRAADMDEGEVQFESASKINKVAQQRITKGIGAPGDVLLSHKGTVGKVALVPADAPAFVCSPQTTFWRTLNSDVLDRRYLHAFLRSPSFHQQLATRADETDMAPYVSLTSQRGLSVTLPPIVTQRAIGCILGAMDDKIGLNRRRNRTLEAMARAIFQSWFVDFDPVRAKVAGRAPAGMSKEVAKLFPSAFEESDLGPIPKGWRVTSLADEITANKGLSYKGEFLCEQGEGLPMHNLNSVYEGGGYKNEGLKWYKGEYQPRHLLKPGDVIVTNTEQGFDHLLIGYAAIVPERYGEKGLFSHHIYRIQQKATSYLPAWFTYLMLRTQRFHEVVAGHSNGTTVNMLPADGLQKPRFVLPPEKLVKRFGEWFVSTQKQLEGLHDENMTLTALRDALLPKLISGELRVPDAERIVGRAT
jgi:type I restriction enzyme S subunit